MKRIYLAFFLVFSILMAITMAGRQVAGPGIPQNSKCRYQCFSDRKDQAIRIPSLLI